MRTDSEIIRDSRGSPRDFGELFDRHAASVHRYAASRVGESIADDVMSETFLVAFERRAAFDHSRQSANPWLLGIATNLLHRHRRSEARRLKAMARSAHEAERRPESGATVEVAMALQKLSVVDRDTILLFAWADLSYEQIADAMQVPLGTVRSRLNRARRTLRAITGTDEIEESSHGRANPAARNA